MAERELLAELSARLAAGEVVRSPDVRALPHDRFVRESLGLVFDEFARHRVVAHLVPGPQHHQALGTVHGGVWSAVIETLASWGAALHAVPVGSPTVGVSNSTEVFRPHREGRIDAVATPGHLEPDWQLWDVVLTRASDHAPVARGTVRLVRFEPSDGGSEMDGVRGASP
jgi:1,4-dihydroxy-2-naphthoyl-CoA hydrolase